MTLLALLSTALALLPTPTTSRSEKPSRLTVFNFGELMMTSFELGFGLVTCDPFKLRLLRSNSWRVGQARVLIIAPRRSQTLHLTLRISLASGEEPKIGPRAPESAYKAPVIGNDIAGGERHDSASVSDFQTRIKNDKRRPEEISQIWSPVSEVECRARA